MLESNPFIYIYIYICNYGEQMPTVLESESGRT